MGENTRCRGLSSLVADGLQSTGQILQGFVDSVADEISAFTPHCHQPLVVPVVEAHTDWIEVFG